MVDDEGIELRANNRIDERFGDKVHVNVTSYQPQRAADGRGARRAGQGRDREDHRTRATVRGVTNDLQSRAPAPRGARANDSAITGKVKARFVDAAKFNAMHVKVVTETGSSTCSASSPSRGERRGRDRAHHRRRAQGGQGVRLLQGQRRGLRAEAQTKAEEPKNSAASLDFEAKIRARRRRALGCGWRGRWCSPTACSTCCTAATSPTSRRRARLGAALVVALNGDASARRLGKGEGRPSTLEDRMALSPRWSRSSAVTWFDDDTPAALIEVLRPEVLVKGGDWPVEKFVGGRETLARGGRVVSIPFEHQRSSTACWKRIRKRLELRSRARRAWARQVGLGFAEAEIAVERDRSGELRQGVQHHAPSSSVSRLLDHLEREAPPARCPGMGSRTNIRFISPVAASDAPQRDAARRLSRSCRRGRSAGRPGRGIVPGERDQLLVEVLEAQASATRPAYSPKSLRASSMSCGDEAGAIFSTKAFYNPASPNAPAPAQDRLRRRAGPAANADRGERKGRGAHVAHAPLRQAALAAAGQAGRRGEPSHPHPAQPGGAQGAAQHRARAGGIEGELLETYDDSTRATPLGAEPLLLARIQTGHDPNGHPVVALHPSEGQGVTLTLDPVLLHSVCRLLQAAVKKSDWDMELKLPGVEPQEAPPERSRGRIN
jgi:hypothetical protein